ncbi:branched-chain amino acid ABC transporter permease [Halobacterium sp. KA-4]|uniref:branched-chain amino acid ABC transporter permease n=1 Tax=Halobacterium sp. KA-4 TaxID=2896367 RepID=UPI001E408B1D|nr:branched-chain amino acid ABC transporter permease [Halobacterium sp. KA-4]MCD2201692.1 branched-chain amino acid ABC transporter permease [Halobacterium sp. KA-4]
MNWNWEQARIAIVTVLLALIPPVLFMNSYVSRLFTLIIIFAVMAMALNIVFGHTDQLFLFSGALMGTGSYTTVLLAQWLGITPWISLLAGALLAGFVGALVCYVATRQNLSVLVIAILTLALQLAFIQFVSGASSITGGSTGQVFVGFGLEGIADSIPGPELTILYYIVLTVFVATMLVYYYITHSKYGLAFDALRQDELAAESVGIDVVRYKTIAGFTAAFIIGFIGPFYVQMNTYIQPSIFGFGSIDVLVLIMLILGSLRTLLGPLVGSVILLYVNQQLQSAGQWSTVILGLLLMFLFLFFRQGIVTYVSTLIEERTDIGERIRSLGSS